MNESLMTYVSTCFVGLAIIALALFGFIQINQSGHISVVQHGSLLREMERNDHSFVALFGHWLAIGSQLELRGIGRA